MLFLIFNERKKKAKKGNVVISFSLVLFKLVASLTKLTSNCAVIFVYKYQPLIMF